MRLYHSLLEFISEEKKPDSLNEFLDQFVAELIKLSQEGIRCAQNNLAISISSFTCNAPARAFISGVKGHSVEWFSVKSMHHSEPTCLFDSNFKKAITISIVFFYS